MEAFRSDNLVIRIMIVVLVMGVGTLCGCRSSRDSGAEAVVIDWNPPAVSFDASSHQDSIPLVLSSLVNSAKHNNPELLALREAMEVARAEAVTVTGLRNPELRVEYNEGNQVTERTWYGNGAGIGTPPEWLPLKSVSDRTVESDGTRYTLRLYPPNPWLMRVQGGGTRARFAAASADLQAAEWQAECAIGSMLTEILGIQRELEIVRNQSVLRRDYLAAVQLLVNQQQATALDELDADQRQMRAEDDAAVLEQALLDRYTQLSVMVGAPVQETPFGGGVGVNESTVSITPEMARTLRGRLVEARADVMAAYWRHQDALALWREKRMGRMPWFTYLQGSYAKSDSSDQVDAVGRQSFNADLITPSSVVSADDDDDEAWSIEAGLEIPVFAFHGGATRIQQANVKRYAVALRESVRKAQTEFDMAYQGWLTAVARAEAASRGTDVRQAKATELIRKLDSAGGMGPEARLKVDEMILQLKRAEIQAVRVRDMAWWRLQGSAGVRLNNRVAE